MKIKFAAFHWLLALLFVLRSAPAVAAINDASEFPYAVQFELGTSEFAAGDSITIAEMRGTQDQIAENGTYCVSGTYTLNSRDRAVLAFYATVPNSGSSRVDPKQRITITKGTGTFRLIKTMSGPGYLHLSFYPLGSGGDFGGVYFGQGDWILRKKSWGPSPDQAGSVAPGPNQAIFEYLGEPVAPPPNLHPSFSRDGLVTAVQLAAQKAGVTLKSIEVDDSEFPFVIGVVSKEGDFDKLADSLKKLEGYEYGGSVGSPTHHAFNIVPWRVFPSESSQRIGRRLTLREQILFDKIMSRQ